MKLYTEEQVRKAINDGSLYSYINGNFEFKNSEDNIVNSLTPIQLPSDEEIETEASDFGKKYRATTYEISAHVIGAKWMRDKILNK